MVQNKASSDKIFNFRYIHNRDAALPVGEVPTLVPNTVMNELTAGDSAPYFRVESIAFPAEGDNPFGSKPAIYNQQFFQSVLDYLKNKPMPGSKRGHEYKSRPASDFYTVGGKIVENGDGTGTVNLKIYIPPTGDETSNAGFVRDNKAGIVEFSIEAYAEFTVNGDTGDVTVISVKGNPRNDAVPEGAMAQTVNAANRDDEDLVLNAAGDKLLAASVRKARGLINAGKYDAKASWSKKSALRKILGANGDDYTNLKAWSLVEHTGAPENTQGRYGYQYGDGTLVYRSALQNIASRASAQNLPDVSKAASDLVDLIHEKSNAKNERSLVVEKDEVMEFLTVNSAIPLEDIAKVMRQDGKIVTPEHLEAVKTVNGLKELGIKDPVTEVREMQKQIADSEKDRVANRLNAEFGTEKDATGKENPLRIYAGQMITNSADLDKQIETFRENPIAKKLAAERADFSRNSLKVVENGGGERQEEGAPVVAEY